ncbi:unnamed protein product [Mytilus coruscus]|uniref:Uncharacterized protein n=1 Tax=Mytilus coruscus TaxID=42192 RepID=A0A6J8A6G1_MYTCO|nr:unnamed protein product [Mytilus coruscus]
MAMEQAITNNDLKSLDNYVANAGDVNVRNENGNTLLHIATAASADIDINGKNIRGESAIHRMVVRSEGELSYEDDDWAANIMYLAHDGADINAQDITSSSPIMLANESKIMQALLNVNASVNIPTKLGQTPLILKLTCKEINTSVIQMLLEHGADVNALDNYHNNALHYLAWEGAGTEALTILQQFGAVSVPEKLEFSRFCEVDETLSSENPGSAYLRLKLEFKYQTLLTELLQTGEPQDFNDVDVASIKNHWNESEDDENIYKTEYWDRSEEMIRELEEK